MPIIVGLQYYDFEDIILKKGDILSLEAEPKNKFDKNAIVALTESRCFVVGYVRKEDNQHTEPGLYKIIYYGPEHGNNYLEVEKIKSEIQEIDAQEYCTSCDSKKIDEMTVIEKFTAKLILCEKCLNEDSQEGNDEEYESDDEKTFATENFEDFEISNFDDEEYEKTRKKYDLPF